MANPNKVGLVPAALVGGWHLLWSHMIQPVYVIKPFDPPRPSGTREVAAGLPSEMHWGCSGSLRWQLS